MMKRVGLYLWLVSSLIGLYGCDIAPEDENLFAFGGVVNKGIIAQAVTQTYKAGSGEPVKQVYTSADGSFSLDGVTFDGTLYVDARTTSQTLLTCDSAYGCGPFSGGLKLAGESDLNLNGQIDFGDQYFYNDPNFKLTAYIQSSADNSGRFAVTALTHLAAESIRASGNITLDNIQLVHAQVAELFGLDGLSINSIVPPDITNENQMQNASPAQRMYATLNAAVATAASDTLLVSDVLAALSQTFVDEGGLVGNSQDPEVISLAKLMLLATEVAQTVQTQFENVEMGPILEKVQQELEENLSKEPDTIVKPSIQPLTELDFDGDGLTDEKEVLLGTDPLDSDTDNDGLFDGKEIELGSNPLSDDTDDDGMPDGWEVRYELDPLDPLDSNGDADVDGLLNVDEFSKNTDPNNDDSDGDGLKDGEEVLDFQTEPLLVDSDSDGLSDYDEVKIYKTNPNSVDSDGDSLPDQWEVTYDLGPMSAEDANHDSDGDALLNRHEFLLSTHPLLEDSDGNGILDGAEDADGDSMPNLFELTYGLNPLVDDANSDQDGDSITNGQEYLYESDPLTANPLIEYISDADLYLNGINSAMFLSLDEKKLLTSSYDLSDLSFTASINGETTFDSNQAVDVLFHQLVLDRYTLPIRQVDDGVSLLSGSSQFQDATPDGLFWLFSSGAGDASVSGDSENSLTDLFVYNRLTNNTVRVGSQSSGNANLGKISASVHVVLETVDSFGSSDQNESPDIFAYKLDNQAVRLVSRDHTQTGTAGGGSYRPDVSHDGSRIVFSSDADNIIDAQENDANNVRDVYFYDMLTDSHKRVSQVKDPNEDDSGSEPGPPAADYPVLSADGSGLVYATAKDILDLPSGQSAYQQLYYVDVEKLKGGASVDQYTVLITQAWNDHQIYGDGFVDPSTVRISADGKHVFYKSSSQNLVENDGSNVGVDDLFLWDKSNNKNYLLSQYVYGKNGTSLIYDKEPSINHTFGMGVQNFIVNADDSSIYAILDYGYEYTSVPQGEEATNCTNSYSHCLYRIRLHLPQLDGDNDGLNDRQEAHAFTDPANSDTDGDGLNDGDEVHQYLSSAILTDTDGDGINDGNEVNNGTDPLDPYDPFVPM